MKKEKTFTSKNKSPSKTKQLKKPKVEEVVIDVIIPDVPVVVLDAKSKESPKKVYYVNPQEFTDELKKYYETDIITDKLALMIKNIAYGLAHAPNFINYTFREEAIGDCLINMFNAIKKKKYNFNLGYNPFSYFNSISFNCWRSRIKKEKRMRDTLAAYQEEMYSILGPNMDSKETEQ
jgi:hypothetical protein